MQAPTPLTPEQCRFLRARFRLAQADLAELLGVSRLTVQRWEAEGGKPPLLLAWATDRLQAYLKAHPPTPRRSAAGKKAWKTRLRRQAEQGQEAP
jgi:DNA-binding transcriptional regulator YiaG